MASVKELNNVFDYKKAITTMMDDFLMELIIDGKNERTLKPDSKLLIITQNAYIEGTINHFDKVDDEGYFFSQGLKELEKRLSGLPEKLEAINLTGPLHLKEVTISPMTNPGENRKLSEMLLFTDQILGITIK
ncbi:hypothetical protein [Bacillus sp. NEB1478]|uniref:hypothetical protein n=1 Tax=Bacillus sp. NEB1478 TaxID=3073816 RepID=UPI00287319A8|nr:hypothetical protein [Bacillus sp. NEB1478]WNB91534.1 hypothetical protein RGB74_16785 [Bacillus sp. NEB1478]